MSATHIEGGTPAGGGPTWPMLVVNLVSRGLMYAAMIALMILAGATVLDVVGRTLFGSFSVRGLYEVTGLAMAVIVAMIVPQIFLERRNLTMDLLLGRMGDKTVLDLVVSVVEIGFLLLVSRQLVLKGYDAADFHETTSILSLSVAPFWYAAGAAFGLAAVALAMQSVVRLARLRHAEGLTAAGAIRALASLAAVGAVFGLLLLLVGAGLTTSGWSATMAFTALYILIVGGLPIGVSLCLTGFGFIYVMIGGRQAFGLVETETVRAISSTSLSAIPLFLLMGAFAVRAGMARDIFRAASSVTAGIRGGLPVASILGCAAFGAISGSSIATTATFGKVAFSEMKERGYSPALATGTLAAGGTLGALIPPSVVLIIYCVLVEVSIQQAFIAALVPGLLAMALYLVAIMVQVRLRPEVSPAPIGYDLRELVCAGLAAWRPVLLFTLVLSGLYGGVFTTQEAAAVGAVLSLVFALMSPGFTVKDIFASFSEAAINTAIIYIVVAGANIFASLLTLSNITSTILSVVDLATTPHWLVLIAIIVMYLILGSVFDTVAAVLVTAPFVIPLISAMDYNLIWWGIVTLSLVEIGMITPPIGMNVFVMRAVIANEVPLSTIFRGIGPFLVADLCRLALLVLFPVLTLWLPGLN